jgi:ankyrin repeat protein
MPLPHDRLEVLQVRKLVQCVRTGDKAQITKLVQHGISGLINYQDPATGEGALHVAVARNDEAVVTQLLDLGASLGTQDLEGKTPLMTACQYGHLQALETLATRGVNMAVTDNAGKPALFHCFHPTNRHAKCLGFLLECGADPNTRDEHGFPVGCGASSEGLERQLERLLDKGADPNGREPREGKPALVLASEGGHVECVRLLMSHPSIDKNATYGEEGLCALHRAASLGQFLVIQVLSAYGADFTVSTTRHENAVFFATRSNHLIVLRLLGQRGSPTNDENEQGVTPQKLAKQEGMKDVMKELKKLTSFQDKIARGAKPKGAAEPWAIQLYDWTQVNKRQLLELCREQQSGEGGVITTEAFTSVLHTMGAPLQSEGLTSLLAIYDKKGEGVMNYDDFISEQKFIHAQYKIGPGDDIKAKKVGRN